MAAVDEELVDAPVFLPEQERHPRGLAVATRAADLLVVGLDAARHVVVDHRADVVFVDAHAEGVRGGDHRHLAPHETVLGGLPFRQFQARVVGPRPGDRGRRLVDVLSRGAVHQRGTSARERADQRVLLAGALDLDHVDSQVGTVETANEAPRLREAEHAEDVGLHLGGGGGGERHRARAAQRFPRLPQSQVVGSEVVPPLAEAVGLVDGEEPHVDPADRL